MVHQTLYPATDYKLDVLPNDKRFTDLNFKLDCKYHLEDLDVDG
jgi:hypothetical protein